MAKVAPEDQELKDLRDELSRVGDKFSAYALKKGVIQKRCAKTASEEIGETVWNIDIWMSWDEEYS